MTRFHTRRALLWIAPALLAMSLWPTVAAAAPVSLAESEVWVQLWPEGEAGTNVVIVGVQLPSDTVLPATVRLPIPEGASVYWAGEIMGSDPAGDVQRQHTIVDTGTGKAAEFTVETTLSVQIDATYGSITIDGNDLISELTWTQTIDSTLTSFAVLMPDGTGDVEISPDAPGEPEVNAAGERLFTLPSAALEPGDEYPIRVVYRRAGVEETPAESGSTLLWVLGGLLLAAVVALGIAFRAQRTAA